MFYSHSPTDSRRVVVSYRGKYVHEVLKLSLSRKCVARVIVRLEMLTGTFNRVPTSSGNHGKPGKSLKKVPCMEKSWNLKKLNNHGKIVEFVK